jgi:hypothetical protein
LPVAIPAVRATTAVMKHVFEPWEGEHLILDTAAMPVADVVHRAEAYVLKHSAKN